MQEDVKCLLCTSQFLVSLGGCQLKLYSLKHEWNLPRLQLKSASAVTESVSKHALVPMGLPVAVGTDM